MLINANSSNLKHEHTSQRYKDQDVLPVQCVYYEEYGSNAKSQCQQISHFEFSPTHAQQQRHKENCTRSDSPTSIGDAFGARIYRWMMKKKPISAASRWRQGYNSDTRHVSSRAGRADFPPREESVFCGVRWVYRLSMLFEGVWVFREVENMLINFIIKATCL